MTNFEGVGIVPADLLLPAAQVDPSAWACIACDQYTSEPEYWHEAAAQVGEKPSCLKLVLPECYLPETESRGVPQADPCQAQPAKGEWRSASPLP